MTETPRYLQEGIATGFAFGPLRERWWYAVDQAYLHVQDLVPLKPLRTIQRVALRDIAYYRVEPDKGAARVVLGLHVPIPAKTGADIGVVHNPEGVLIVLPLPEAEAAALAQTLETLDVPRRQPGDQTRIVEAAERQRRQNDQRVAATTGMSRATWDVISVGSTLGFLVYMAVISGYIISRYGWSGDLRGHPDALVLLLGIFVFLVPMTVSYFYTVWQDLAQGAVLGRGKVVMFLIWLLSSLVVAQLIGRLLAN